MSHGNARLTVFGRHLLCRRICEDGWSVARAALAAGVSRQTADKWLARYRCEGTVGLHDRRSRPHRIARGLPALAVRAIVRARLRFRCGPHRLSWMLGLARSSIYAVLRRLGLNRLRRLDAVPAQATRYVWPAAGDLVHLDTKKLGRIGAGGGKRFGGMALKDRHRGIGWNCVHVAVDDHSRLAYAEELPDERGESAAAFLERALAFYGAHGIAVVRVLTDNGNCYRSGAYRAVCEEHAIRRLYTRPYRPQTNGKAEAFVKLLQSGWAYRRPYRDTAERSAALPAFLAYYNGWRPHGGLDGATPLERIRQ
jgi:transposase InsO family protein